MIDAFRLDKRLITAALVGSLGGLVFGYDLGALSASTQSLKLDFLLSPAAFGLTVSASLWGTICGSILAGRFADTVGRRALIASSALIYAFAALLIVLPFPRGWLIVLAMRFLCGISIGGLTVGCPLFLSEVAPIEMRGRFVGLFQVQVGIGVVVAFSLGSLLSHLAHPAPLWKWCLGFGALPAAALLLLLRLLPEDRNPAFAWAQDHPEGESGNIAVGQAELLLPSQEIEGEGSFRNNTLFSRKNLRPILLATSIAVFNQLSGVNVLLLYLLDIMSSAGIGHFIRNRYTILISCLSLATTLMGTVFVDKLGRKPLLILGCAGMAICLFSLGLAIPYHFGPLVYLLILVAYNTFFAFSQGATIWVYLSELFPAGVRGRGEGYGTSVHWIANAILVFTFPMLQSSSAFPTFYFFALMMVLQIGVVWLWYPETRGTTLGSLAVTDSGNA